MGTHPRGDGRGLRADGTAGRCAERPGAPGGAPEPAGSHLTPAFRPLPPLRRSAAPVEAAAVPEGPSWSPALVSLALFAAVWACFSVLTAAVGDTSTADVGRLGHLLTTGVAVVALVLVTLSVTHTQVSGLRPRLDVVGVVVLGLLQGRVAAVLASGPSDLWGPAAHVFELIGLAVPLAWVGGQFQQGVRRQRVEHRASLTASWMERARHQAHQTAQSVHRHDVRSMLFVIDGAARALTESGHGLPDDQRAAFAEMLTESVARLGSLTEVRTEDIQPFAIEDVARAIVHAERKAGRTVVTDLPAGLTAAGRAADAAAALRTLIAVIARTTAAGVQLRGEVREGAVVIRVEPSGAEPLPLLARNWEEISDETFKISLRNDEEGIDLFVAARLLADQGADLWSTARRTRFAVRLPAAGNPTTEDEA